MRCYSAVDATESDAAAANAADDAADEIRSGGFHGPLGTGLN